MEDSVQLEYEEIKGLIPPKGISVEERAKLNSIIREKLPNLNIRTLGLLFHHCNHDLSAREIEKRLDAKKDDSLGDLLFLYRNMAEIPGMTFPKRAGKLMEKIFKNLTEQVESFDQKNIVSCVEEHGSSSMPTRNDILAEMVGRRSDHDEIIEKLKSHGIYNDLVTFSASVDYVVQHLDQSRS